MYLVSWFLFGLILGSFANAAIFRLPRGESLLWPPSRCPSCLSSIRYYDNIPVLSYFFLGGRCRYCSGRISWRYPFVEVLTAVLFLWNARIADDFGRAIVGSALILFLVVISGIDLEHRLIPDSFSIAVIILGFAYSFNNEFLGETIIERIVNSCLGAGFGALGLWMIGWMGRKIWKKDVMGLGDVKLLAAQGALVGYRGVWEILVGSTFLGALFGFVSIVMGRLRRRDYLPFGPFLSLAGIYVWWYPQIILKSFSFILLQ